MDVFYISPQHLLATDYEPSFSFSVDAAVIRTHRAVATSSVASEVTAYEPTNDISSRYTVPTDASNNQFPSSHHNGNQFPSSHQEGGLTSSLNDRVFSQALPVAPSIDAAKRSLPSMTIISGVTESHKLEQEQLRAPKPSPPPVTKPVPQKPRKAQNKFMQTPSQPVVMPRSAQMVNDIEQQFSGLEFGSAPLSPTAPSQQNNIPSPVAAEPIKTSVPERYYILLFSLHVV